MNLPIYADAHHRRDNDALTEKLWAARVYMNQQKRIARRAPAVPTLIERRRKRA